MRIVVWVGILLCLVASWVQAEEVVTPTPPAVNVFTNPWQRLFSGSESSFSAALSYSTTLEKTGVRVPTGEESSVTHQRYNQRALLSMQYSPLSYFFANITLGTPIQDASKYSTNFVYSFGYDDWHPGTFSLVYGNYGSSNYFYPAKGDQHTYFDQGKWTLAYKFSLPASIEPYLLLNQKDNLICQVGYSYVARFYSLADNGLQRNKNQLLASCGYTLLQHYFLRVSTFYYLDDQQQQPWDSDYTYSFGYVSSYLPGAVSLRYDNYSGARYPWRASSSTNFRQGTINLSWTLPF